MTYDEAVAKVRDCIRAARDADERALNDAPCALVRLSRDARLANYLIQFLPDYGLAIADVEHVDTRAAGA